MSWRVTAATFTLAAMSLIHLMYASTLHPELMTAAGLEPMLERARVSNDRHDISSVLLLSDAHCFQVLEGPPDTVDALYSKIALDSRHRDVSLMMRWRIGRRNFARWNLATVRVEAEDLRRATAIPTLMSPGFTTTSLGRRQADRLIDVLKSQLASSGSSVA
ncbi:hypothetical protein BH10PSE17_BH10PSE17_25830 [soil metagenome]